MILYPLLDGVADREMPVKAEKCPRRPKFSSRFGRTWQWGNSLVINNKSCPYTYDNTWGSYWYFEYEKNWYKVHITYQYEPHYNMRFVTNEPK